ncbi:hypothetical protein [Streptomyces swartbergensis]|uniref:hypothetical protein n=1 Tax=Streptomyces swartbergensis TaxID=487165 RepID=UPI0038034CD4
MRDFMSCWSELRDLVIVAALDAAEKGLIDVIERMLRSVNLLLKAPSSSLTSSATQRTRQKRAHA